MQIVIDIDEYDYEKVKELVSEGLFDYEGITPHLFKSVVNGTPTRKKGKWIERELVQCHIRGDRKILVCSNCNLGIANGILGFANFCPTCGADMRGNKE